jgi:hypothetical protein
MGSRVRVPSGPPTGNQKKLKPLKSQDLGGFFILHHQKNSKEITLLGYLFGYLI